MLALCLSALLSSQTLQPRPIPPIDWNDLPYQETVRRMAQGWRARYGLPGVWCAFIKDGRVVACVADGYRNLETKSPADVRDHLNIGSVSKVITGTLIAELVAKGVITYATTFGQTFPELAKRYPDSPLLLASLRQLLNHTAGFPRDGSKYGSDDGGGVAWRRSWVEDALNRNDIGVPGTSYLYSNMGPVAATAMVERVIEKQGLGRSFGASWEDWYYGPLGKAMGLTSPRMLNYAKPVAGDEVQPYYMSVDCLPTANRKPEPNSFLFAPQGSCSLTLVDLCRFAIGTMNNAAGLPPDIYSRTVTISDSVDPKGKRTTVRVGKASRVTPRCITPATQGAVNIATSSSIL